MSINEPYRLVLSDVRARLQSTKLEVRHGRVAHAWQHSCETH